MDSMKLGDSAQGVWMGELVNNCLRDHGDGVAVDLNLMVQMCHAEPENAQFAMQLFAQDLKKDLGNTPVDKAPTGTKSLRLLLGSLYLAYTLAQHLDSGRPPDEFDGRDIPPELRQILEWHPIILECCNFVLEANAKRFSQ